MELHVNYVYWYPIIIYADKKGNGIRRPTSVRIPVKCIKTDAFTAEIEFLNPGSSEIEQIKVTHNMLYDSTK